MLTWQKCSLFSPASFTLTVYSSSSAIRYSVPCNVLLGGCGLCMGKGHNLLEACLGHIWLSYQVEKLLAKLLSQSCLISKKIQFYIFLKNEFCHSKLGWLKTMILCCTELLLWLRKIKALIASIPPVKSLDLLHFCIWGHWHSSDLLPVF